MAKSKKDEETTTEPVAAKPWKFVVRLGLARRLRGGRAWPMGSTVVVLGQDISEEQLQELLEDRYFTVSEMKE